jgi:phosphoribosylaminoimidazole carboxylase PurE protein
MKKQVLILIGSASDQSYADEAGAMLSKLGLGFDIEISSAHRHPGRTATLAAQAADNGYQVIICMAGMAAHLPGVVAAHTLLPVIGVPLPASLAGVDSLMSMAQMPPGIPVATVAVGLPGARNSAVLAARIIGLTDPTIAENHRRYRESL